MIVMNCFCEKVDRRKTFSVISSQDHCQRSLPSQISNALQAGLEPAQNLSWGFVKWSCIVVITTTPQSAVTSSKLYKLYLILKYKINCLSNKWSTVLIAQVVPNLGHSFLHENFIQKISFYRNVIEALWRHFIKNTDLMVKIIT